MENNNTRSEVKAAPLTPEQQAQINLMLEGAGLNPSDPIAQRAGVNTAMKLQKMGQDRGQWVEMAKRHGLDGEALAQRNDAVSNEATAMKQEFDALNQKIQQTDKTIQRNAIITMISGAIASLAVGLGLRNSKKWAGKFQNPWKKNGLAAAGGLMTFAVAQPIGMALTQPVQKERSDLVLKRDQLQSKAAGIATHAGQETIAFMNEVVNRELRASYAQEQKIVADALKVAESKPREQHLHSQPAPSGMSDGLVMHAHPQTPEKPANESTAKNQAPMQTAGVSHAHPNTPEPPKVEEPKVEAPKTESAPGPKPFTERQQAPMGNYTGQAEADRASPTQRAV
jgi:hypothetical protein